MEGGERPERPAARRSERLLIKTAVTELCLPESELEHANSDHISSAQEEVKAYANKRAYVRREWDTGRILNIVFKLAWTVHNEKHRINDQIPLRETWGLMLRKSSRQNTFDFKKGG